MRKERIGRVLVLLEASLIVFYNFCHIEYNFRCQEIDCQGPCEMTSSDDIIFGHTWLRINWYKLFCSNETLSKWSH